MDFTINNTPFEEYFGENPILQTIGICAKYYLGNVIKFSVYTGLIGGTIGGIIGASSGMVLSIASPYIIYKAIKQISFVKIIIE